MIVYKVTNLLSGKIYIGQDSRNRSSYYGSGIILKKAIKKYGKQNFKKEILEHCESKDHMNEREIFWIAEYKKMGHNLYNIAIGGHFSISHHSEETKRKIREKRKLQIMKPVSPETRSKISKADKELHKLKKIGMYGKHHSDASKKKLSISHSGEKNWMYGRKMDEKHKQKLISINTGSKLSDDTRNKISQATKGKIVSEDQKQHMRDAKKNKSAYKTTEFREKRRNLTTGENNPMFGKSVYNLWVDKYGKDVADEKMRLMQEKRKKNRELKNVNI